MAVSPEVIRLARGVRLLILDVDGVLTDGAMYYSESGDEWKRFHTYDGHGINAVQAAGIRVAIVTRENTAIVTRRAAKLRIDDLHQGVTDKLPVVQALAQKHGVAREAICYVGDDLGDREAMQWVGLPVAVANARPEICRIALYQTETAGGYGAVREVCDTILMAQGHLAAE